VFVVERAQRLVGAAKRLPVPEGTYAIGAGLLIAGLTAYGFQIIAAAELSDDAYAALNSLWAIVFVVAPGLFQPLEQEVARALAHRRAIGIGGGPLVRRAAVLGGILALTVGAACLVFSQPLIDRLFHDYAGLMIALFVSLGTYYFAHITRGTLSGNGRFGPYGLMHASEGAVRILFCLALVVVGATSPGMYGLALCIPPLVAVGISLRGQRGLLNPGPEAPYSELSGALALLLVGSLLAQLLSYASFLGVTLLADPDETEAVSGFITGLFIARIPILLFQAVQAALLPKLAGLTGAGKHDDFRQGIRRLLVIVAGLAVIGVIGGLVLGPWAGELLFPEKWILGRRDMALLAAGSGAFIVALTLAQGLIALKAYRHAMLAWLAGIIAFVAATTVSTDLFLRVEIGFVAGGVVAAVVMASLLFVQMRRGIRATVEDLVEVIEHEPLEI
jgi:O-antigen/teichoic acid export membrane protein